MHEDFQTAPELDSFDSAKRLAALHDTASMLKSGSAGGLNHAGRLVNMHIHSFYSFNSLGYSPAHAAVACRRAGLYAAALCDFDVLDGLEEFLLAGRLLGLRTAVHIETRVFMREYARADINSPGEPGVAYIMGAGFGRMPEPDSKTMKTLQSLRRQANARNRDLTARINARLPEIALDYDAEVLALSPGGCPTERHIVKGYRLKAESVFPDTAARASFWSKILRVPEATAGQLMGDSAALDEKIRSALAKKGGIGYVQPDETTFPPADDFIRWVLDCGAIPMVTWLDGTSAGEGDIVRMLECLRAKGAAAVNIIPDRNHNIANADERRIKTAKLGEAVAAARKLAFPINIGTEMNKAGQPFADDLACESLVPYREDFLRGAEIMVGQAILARYAAFSYCGRSAAGEFGRDTAGKNEFFRRVGALGPLTTSAADALEQAGCGKAFRLVADSSAAGRWLV